MCAAVVRRIGAVGHELLAKTKRVPREFTGPLKSGARAGPWDLKGGLPGERQEYLRKPFGKAFNSVDNTEVLAENPPDIIVGLSIKTDAMAVNPFTFQFAYRLPRIGDEKLRITYIDVRGLTVGQDEQQALVLFSV